MTKKWSKKLLAQLFKSQQVLLRVDAEQTSVEGQQAEPVFENYKVVAIINNNVITRDARRRITRNADITIQDTGQRRLEPGDEITLPDGYRMSVDTVSITNPSGDDVYYEATLSG